MRATKETKRERKGTGDAIHLEDPVQTVMGETTLDKR